MAKRKVNRLDAKKLPHLTPGVHADGNGLCLDVQDSGSRSWILRTLVCRRACAVGLGGYPMPLQNSFRIGCRIRRAGESCETGAKSFRVRRHVNQS
jgi:Arm DNA-binding domain